MNIAQAYDDLKEDVFYQFHAGRDLQAHLLGDFLMKSRAGKGKGFQ